MYACLSGVKPRCALTPACQMTNPKGLLSLSVASGLNYACPVIVCMHLLFDLLINHIECLRLPPQITPSGLVFWQGRVKALPL